MAQKKYASLSTLSSFLDNLKNLFATKSDLNTGLSSKADTSHKHSISDTTNLQSTLDGKVPTSRTINNKPLSENITLSASDIGAASSTHDHNDKYYTQSQVDSKLSGKSDSTHSHSDLYYTKNEIDNYELITVDDIDAICGSDITSAANLTF